MKQELPWSDEEIAVLMRLQPNEDYSYAMIGKKLGRSKNAVVGKVHRLVKLGHLVARDNPVRRISLPASARLAAPGRLARRIRSSMPAVRQVVRPNASVQPPMPDRARVDSDHGVGCQFPLWGNRERSNGRFCYAERRSGSSYCPYHDDICVVRRSLLKVRVPTVEWNRHFDIGERINTPDQYPVYPNIPDAV